MINNVTISDVSRKAGVSKSTVSNYLNGRYEKMSAETKQLIDRTVKELGYVPNLSARRLPNKEKSQTICLIIPRNLTHLFDSMYYPVVFHSIEKLAAKMNYNILIYSRNREDENQVLYLKGLASSMVDGFIVFDLEDQDKFFKEFEIANIPYICVGKIDDYEDYHYIASDHGRAMENALEYLIQLGHRRIGIFKQYDSSVVENTRKKAILHVIEKHNLKKDDIRSIEIEVKSTDQEIYDIWRNTFNDENCPTAFILSSVIQQHFLLAANDLKIKIPEDISYINIEYYPKNNFGNEMQTRVESRAGFIAEQAFKKLLRDIYGTSTEFESEIVPLELTIGATTSKPKQ